MLLDGKVAIVSGIGPGLGRELALAFAREGAVVVMGARTEATLAQVTGEIEDRGGRCSFVPTDITDAGQCERLVAHALDEHGRVDCLVNNAFVPDAFEPFESVDLAKWRRIFDVNVWGSLELTQRVVAPMKAQGSGAIVFVSSLVVRKPVMLQSGYTASKGALLAGARALAKELGPLGIRVNSIVPGWMWGPSVEGYFAYLGRERGISAQDVYDERAAETALNRLAPDDECANAAVFLASDLASVVTGQAIDVSAGEVFR